MERLEAAMIKARAARAEALERANAAEAAAEAAAEVAAQAGGQTGPQAAGEPRAPGSTAAGAAAGAAAIIPLPPVQIGPALARRRRLTALLGPGPATPHDILRARVVRQMAEKRWRRLAVTSPTTQCGKSTVALNLALSMARYGQLRILLVDFDLRHPALARLLDLRDPPDLAGLLQGGKLIDHAFSFGTNLALVPNGQPILRSAELLQDEATLGVLDRLEAEWQSDITIFDLPPMQGNDDTLSFLPQVDCALIVAAAEASTIPQIDRCEAEVGQLTNVLGLVLNKCRYTDRITGFDQAYY